MKLLLTNKGCHTKDELIEKLWPDSSLSSGDANLRTTLNYVRKIFRRYGLLPDSLLLQRGLVYLNTQIEVYGDYEIFTSATRKAVSYVETGNPYAATALEYAARMYNGSFLPEDVYEDWTDSTRTRLHGLYLEVLFQLARVHYAQNNLTAALKACLQYLDCEPIDESAARMAMEILQQSGKRREALLIYKKLVATLSLDYDAAPAPETTTLYQNIRQSRK